MAVPAYPSSLPYVPLRDPHEVSQRHRPLVTTEMEDGPKRQRAASTAVWSQHAYQLLLTAAQFAIFDAFVMVTLGQGVQRFTMPVGRFQQTETTWPSKLVYIEGGAYTSKVFGDGYVLVTFTLNVLDW